VRVVDQEGNLPGFLLHRLCIPPQRLLLLTEHGVNSTDEVLHHRIAVFVTYRTLESLVRAVRLACRHEKLRHLRPCRAVVWRKLRDRAESADSGPRLFQLERNEPDQEMSLDQIRLRIEQPPA